ncbi:MAG: preprotein translocase subunit SecG [Candidatus Brocadiia bacterium]
MLNFVYYTCWIILIIDCILLILLILAQESKAQGLGGLGGGMDLSFAGHTQRTAKRMTAIFAVVFGITLITILVIAPKVGRTGGGTLPDVPLPAVSLSPENVPGVSFAPVDVPPGVTPPVRTPPAPTIPVQAPPPQVPPQNTPPVPGN